MPQHTIKIDSPSKGLLDDRAKENGTTADYEAGLAISRELNRVALDLLRHKSPSKGKQDD